MISRTDSSLRLAIRSDVRGCHERLETYELSRQVLRTPSA